MAYTARSATSAACINGRKIGPSQLAHHLGGLMYTTL